MNMKPTSTPGAYSTVTEAPPKWELPAVTMPTKAPKVMLPLPNMLPGLTFNGTGKNTINLNATMLLNNLTQCATCPALRVSAATRAACATPLLCPADTEQLVTCRTGALCCRVRPASLLLVHGAGALLPAYTLLHSCHVLATLYM